MGSYEICRYFTSSAGCQTRNGFVCPFVHTKENPEEYYKSIIKRLQDEILFIQLEMDKLKKIISEKMFFLIEEKKFEHLSKDYEFCIDLLLAKNRNLVSLFQKAILDVPITHEELENDCVKNGLVRN